MQNLLVLTSNGIIGCQGYWLEKAIGRLSQRATCGIRRLILAWKELLGFIGGAFVALGFVPQVWRLFRLRSAHEISLPFTLFFLAGVAFWLSYGISLALPSVIVWNAITFVLGSAMLYAKLRYGK